jgi:RNA 2',3'-cyclic 3'-phosphodiesterase
LSEEPTRRLFFALWPDEAQRAALWHATAKTVRRCGGRPVAEANLHMTLTFLGSVPESRVASVQGIARRTADGFRPDGLPLALTLERLEHWAEPQILAVAALDATPGVQGSGVQALAGMLTRAAAGEGFSRDLKPFRAHVTVARKVARAPRARGMRPVRWSFDAFALVESRTLPSGPVYSIVESYALGSAEKVGTQE